MEYLKDMLAKKKEKQVTFSSKIEKPYLLFHYQRKRKR
jgi:hypothetical protein